MAARAQRIREGKEEPMKLDREVMDAIFGSKVSYLQKSVDWVKESLAAGDEEKLVEALENLEEQVTDIDNANDLDNLGGVEPVVGLLSHPSNPVRTAALWVIGTAAQSNPSAQVVHLCAVFGIRYAMPGGDMAHAAGDAVELPRAAQAHGSIPPIALRIPSTMSMTDADHIAVRCHSMTQLPTPWSEQTPSFSRSLCMRSRLSSEAAASVWNHSSRRTAPITSARCSQSSRARKDCFRSSGSS
eukprot:3444616-Rhodomonas_salina.1